MEKYNLLKALSGIIIFLAWLELIGAIVLIVITVNSVDENLLALYYGIAGLIGFVLLLSFGKLIELALDIRSNQSEQIIQQTKTEPTSGGVKKKEKTTDISDEQVNKLRELLTGEIKGKLFGTKVNNEVIDFLNAVITSKEVGVSFLEKYNQVYQTDLIDDLKGLSTKYDEIKKYLTRLIEFDIVNEEYPYNLK